MVTIKELIDHFNLNLNFSNEILNLNLEGDYLSYSKESDDQGIFYRFEDEGHEIILSDNASEAVIYSEFEDKTLPPHTTSYNQEGLIIAIS